MSAYLGPHQTPPVFEVQRGVAGDILLTYVPPCTSRTKPHTVVIVPPFAEEMTRVRRMMFLQAQKLSSRGFGTLIPDLYGTGDSEGDFCDARWDIWRSDLSTAVEWVQARNGEVISLLGIRLGAMLALDFARNTNNMDIRQTVLWQPVTHGKASLREFLRLRVVAGMMQKALPRVTLDQLLEKLRDGQTINVAGYDLSAELAAQIDALVLEPLGSVRAAPVHWIEMLSKSGTGEETIDKWNARDIATRKYVIDGFPFWAEWEVRVVQELLEITEQALVGEPA